MSNLKIVLGNSTWVLWTFYFITGCLKIWHRVTFVLQMSLSPRYQFSLPLTSNYRYGPRKRLIGRPLMGTHGYTKHIKPALPTTMILWTNNVIDAISFGLRCFINGHMVALCTTKKNISVSLASGLNLQQHFTSNGSVHFKTSCKQQTTETQPCWQRWSRLYCPCCLMKKCCLWYVISFSQILHRYYKY